MSTLCPIETIISAEEFCQAVGVSREVYERDRARGLIPKNGNGGELLCSSARFHNTFDILHYVLVRQLSRMGLGKDFPSLVDVAEGILDRLAECIECQPDLEESIEELDIECSSLSPLLFEIIDTENDVLVLYRRLGETIYNIQTVLGGTFQFKIMLSNALDSSSERWESRVFLKFLSTPKRDDRLLPIPGNSFSAQI